jgi:hypothetical protein
MVYELLAEGESSGGGTSVVTILLVVGYFLPTMIAAGRDMRNVGRW